MASPINDKRTHEEQHTRRYVFQFLVALTVDKLSITTTVTISMNYMETVIIITEMKLTTTVNDNIHELYP